MTSADHVLIPRAANNAGRVVLLAVLYAIVGILGLSCAITIVLALIKARRHPETYGPRNAESDRPPQTRARGLAKAILDTLPVVSYRAQGDHGPDTTDIELGSTASQRDSHQPPESTPTSDAKQGPTVGNVAREECCICVELFKLEERIRILPCEHKFHAECIDPWLEEHSEQCPLCRLDLGPPKQAENERTSVRVEDTWVAFPINRSIMYCT